MSLEIREVTEDKCVLCRTILNDLPEWFGIPESTKNYIHSVKTLPMIGCFDQGDGIGFITLKFHTSYAAELYVLGIKKAYHRQGIGRMLFHASEKLAKKAKLKWLTVKTLSASHPDPYYAQTRQFYESVGFLPIEELPTLWGEANPCLLMVKPL